MPASSPIAPKSNVVALAPTSAQINPLAAWPPPGDVPDLLTIVQDQAATIMAQEALLHAYQTDLNNAQAPSQQPLTATGIGTSTGTTQLTVTSANNNIALGSVVAGVGVPTGTTVTNQTSGTAGGNGTYTLSQATTLAGVPMTFTPPANVSPWPTPRDAPTLMLIQQDQTAIIRTNSALMQQMQALLNDSQTTVPPTGP